MFRWFTGKTTEPPKQETQKTVEPAQPTAEGPSTPINELPQQAGSFAKLREAVSLTGKSLVGKIFGVLQESELDEDTIDEIEEILIRSDVGLDTSVMIADRLRDRQNQLKTTEELMAFLRKEFSEILTPFEKANHLRFQPGVLNVYLVVGVNGAGKTTFIGKLANRFVKDGKKVVIGAGDTFRAAAVEQLEVWAERAGAEFVGMKPDDSGKQADPAAVIYDAIRKGRETGADVVILDTAGRLQNKFNLMEELRKIRKVIEKEMPPGGQLESLLVLDATTGQNALKQAEVFKEAVEVSGVVLTKLDSSAKGGVILTIAKEHRLPVKMVGVGEGIEDLKEFNAHEFVDALFARA